MATDKKYLTKKSENLSKWYGEIIEKAHLAAQAPVKGTIVIMPYAYSIWEKLQSTLDSWFKEDGVKNAYFPLFIPMSLLEKEKKHVEGFSPELAVVTIGGGEELQEKLAVRPTSETIMYQMFANWISSYKDLPLKINQWCNVVRWEKRTYAFLRTTEFLWQEGHTVHKDEDEAMDMVIQALDWYKKIYEEYMGISVYVGEKSNSEKFAGAKRTFSIELVIPDGKALQGATSHNLGQNFSKSFEIEFLNEKNEKKFPFQTSWGFSTRALGGLILSHGDDQGLILPPMVAPYQVVIIPIYGKTENKDLAIFIKKISLALESLHISYKIDTNTNQSFGYRLNEAEMQGVPVRIEVGEREMETESLIVARRDTLEKEKIVLKVLEEHIPDLLLDIQKGMFKKSKELKESLTKDVETYQEFKEIMLSNKQFIRTYWCESEVCERKIKEETKATTRVCELERLNDQEDGKCIYCGNKARRKWLFAQTY